MKQTLSIMVFVAALLTFWRWSSASDEDPQSDPSTDDDAKGDDPAPAATQPIG